MSSLNSLSQGISNGGRIAGVEASEHARPAVGTGSGRIVGTVDEKVMKALREKANLAKTLVDEYQAGANPFN